MIVVAVLCLAGLAGEKVAFSTHQLELELPAIEGLARAGGEDSERLGSWHGTASGSAIEIQLWFVSRPEKTLVEPEELHEGLQVDDGPDAPSAGQLACDRSETFAGPLGYAPYAHLLSGVWSDGESQPAGRLWSLAGLLEGGAWVLRVTSEPPPTPELEAQLLAFLKSGLRYSGKVRDGSWTKAEIDARWKEHSPADAIEDVEKPIVTEHYLIIGNSSGGKAFAKKMEEAYDTIQKVYPFAEVPGRKKLIVFLFKIQAQYVKYFAKIADISEEQAERSKGHAWRDYYATWYEAPNDPVHIHEATHQIFSNRLFLSGAGSWFQEGVAEYIETKPGDRGAAATAVKKERHLKLAEFMKIESLLMSSDEDAKGGDQSGDHYKQAALLVEFVRESKLCKAKFVDYIQRMGRVPDNDLPAIERVLKELFGTDLAAFEKEFVRYCQKR